MAAVWLATLPARAELAPLPQPASPRAPAKAAAPSKAQTLESLKQIQRKQIQTLENVDQSIRRTLSDSQSVNLRGGDPLNDEKQMQAIPQRLSSLQARREELLLRRDFLDQIIFQVDSKWTTQPLAVFLEQTLLDMAAAELTSNPPAKTDFWRFYTYLSIAIREISEPREDLIAFLSGYLEFSGVQKPKSPLAYLETRNYTAGSMSQAARPGRRDEVGSGVERRLRALGLKDGTTDATGASSPGATNGAADGASGVISDAIIGTASSATSPAPQSKTSTKPATTPGGRSKPSATKKRN